MIAVCLGRFNRFDHFYTIAGEWFATQTLKPRFVVKNFIRDPADLGPVISALPSVTGAADILRLLREQHAGPSRPVGAKLIQKMIAFQAAVHEVQQKHIRNLSAASTLLGPEEKIMTLRQIASVLLRSGSMTTSQQLFFSPEELYAVHITICKNDTAFRPLERTNHSGNSCVFAVNAQYDASIIDTTEDVVRQFLERPPASPVRLGTSVNVFVDFVDWARSAIDNSRTSRDWSPHGMLSPCKQNPPEPRPTTPHFPLTSLHHCIVEFMHLWAASDRFNRSSRLHWLGAAILRAVDRYDEAETLDASVGWTFLQEIGWISPWELHTRHAMRLPGVQLLRSGGVEPWPEDAKQIDLEPDQLEPLRKDFADLTVYCIDSEDTADVDDGISLERTKEGEHWIHVHVADPASRIRPDSWQAERAARLTQSSYLAGHEQPMFKDDIVRKTFSLAPGSPSLTFSAKVTESGELADYKITPGIIRKVVYVTPEDVSRITGDDKSAFPVPPGLLEVGVRPNITSPTRQMTKAEDLSGQQQEDIKTLGRLAHTLHKTRLENGATPAYTPRLTVNVSLQHSSLASMDNGFVVSQGDPYIRVQYEESSGSPLISSLMQLAGQVAAKWCHARGIPIPYRIQALARPNAKALRAYTSEVLYPQLLAGKIPSPDDYRVLRKLVGNQDISTIPSLNFSMGLDMYTKATSPLRRFSDLLVHWQIEAALLEEHRRGSSLIRGSSVSYAVSHVSTKSEASSLSFLPFSRRDLDERIFPQLRVREQYTRLLQNYEGTEEWFFQALLRAWKFGDSPQPLPETFRFTAVEVVPSLMVIGTINWFDRRAIMELEHLGSVAPLAEVKAGDVFTVKLQNVNVHSRRILVRALERVSD